MKNKNSLGGIVVIMLMLAFSCIISISTAAKSPSYSTAASPLSSKSGDDNSKDGNAAAAVKELCAKMENPTKCEQFLGNSPKPDPTHIVKFNLRILKTLVEEGAYISSNDENKNPSTPENMKKSLNTCGKNYNKTVESLDAARVALGGCEKDAGSSKDNKCQPEHVGKVNSMLNDAVSNFEKCGKALGSAGSPPTPWIKELNDAMIDDAHILLEVAKKIK